MNFVIKFNDDDVVGHTNISGYEKAVPALGGYTFGSYTFGGGPPGTGKEAKATVHCSGVDLTIKAGPWVPSLILATYNFKRFKKIEIVELDIAQSGKPTLDAKEISTLTLSDVQVVAVDTDWGGTGSTIHVVYKHLLLSSGGKVAEFVNPEV